MASTHPVTMRPGADEDHALVRRHGVSAVVGRILNLASAVLMTLILARVLSPHEFAEFNVIRIGMTLFAVTASAGIAQTSLRLLGRSLRQGNREEAVSIVHASARLSAVPLLVAGISIFVLSLVVGWRVSRVGISWLDAFAIAAGTVIFAGSDLIADLIRGLGHPEAANAVGGTKGATIANVLLLLTVVCLPWFYDEIDSIQATNAATIATGIVLVAGIRFLTRCTYSLNAARRTSGAFVGEARSQIMVQIRRASFPVAFSAGLTFCCYQGDVFLVALFSDPAEIPAYVAARRLVILLSIPLTIANTMASGVISPLISSGRRELLQAILQAAAGAASVPCLLLAVFAMIFPEKTLELTLGPGYESSARILQILIPGQVLLVLTGSCGVLMVQTGNQRTFLWLNLAAFLFLVGCSIPAAMQFGATGLATAVSALIGGGSLVIWQTAIRLTGINTWCSLSQVHSMRALFRSPHLREARGQVSSDTEQ